MDKSAGLMDILLTLRDSEQRKDYAAEKELGFAVVGVGNKPVPRYTHYVQQALEDGIEVFHLLAQGYSNVVNAHRVANHFVESGSLNVFLYDDDEQEDQKGEITPVAVITLVSSRQLGSTLPEIWSPDLIDEWRSRRYHPLV